MLLSALLVFVALLYLVVGPVARLTPLLCTRTATTTVSGSLTAVTITEGGGTPFSEITGDVKFGWLTGSAILTLLGAAALLCGLRQTLGRCRVRTIQVFRVIAYAVTPICLIWIALLVADELLTSLIDRWTLAAGGAVLAGELAVLLHMLLAVVCIGALAVYMTAGLKYYLRIPRPALLGVTAAFVGSLLTVTLIMLP